MAKKVLVIEDDDSLLEGLRLLLEAEGYEVLEACDARKGLKVAQQQPPDLIMSDLHMPWGDGYKVLRRVRQDPRTSRVPVVIMSVDCRSSSVNRCEEVGADAFLEKPFTYEELTETIHRMLESP